MTVMVDELRVWPHAHGCFRAGSCHLTSSSLDELHVFAARLGLRREWFQEHPIASHYDLTPSKRALALHYGAVFVSARQQSIARRVAKLQIP